MSGQFQNPNLQQPEDMNFNQVDPSPQVSQADIDSEIMRSTQPLHDYMERSGIGAENRRIAGERILQIAGIVRDNPERVAADSGKPPQHRTEHDPERAHLMALAIDGNMTKLAAQNRRLNAGKNLLPWQRSSRDRQLVGARMGENMAVEVYNDDPAEVGSSMVESRRQRSIKAGGTSYKLIKSAKLPRR